MHWVPSVAFLLDGWLLASAGSQHTVRLWGVAKTNVYSALLFVGGLVIGFGASVLFRSVGDDLTTLLKIGALLLVVLVAGVLAVLGSLVFPSAPA